MDGTNRENGTSEVDLHGLYRHVDSNFAAYVDDMRNYLQVPGFSATGEGIPEAIAATVGYLKDVGCGGVEVLPMDGGNPIVCGRLTSRKPGVPTLVMYGWYDMIPVAGEKWVFPPLGATIVDAAEIGLASAIGRVITSRGVRDRRGPVSAFLSACKAIAAVSKDLPVNVTFIVEGEEESGSPSLGSLRAKYADKLAGAEAVLMPNVWEDDRGRMYVFRGGKGIADFELVVEGGEWGGTVDGRDLFSGDIAWVDAPIVRLVKALATLIDDDNRPAIDGFFDNHVPPAEDDRAELEVLVREFDEEEMKRWMGIRRFRKGLSGREQYEAYIMDPWVNIDGITGGYTGEGNRTLLPMKATAKVDVRMGPALTPDEVASKLRQHLDRRGFREVQMRRISRGYRPFRTPRSAHVVQSALKAADALGIPYRVWPTMPACVPFEAFGLPAVISGPGNSGRAHRQDEYLAVEGLRQAIKYFIAFLYEFGRLEG